MAEEAQIPFGNAFLVSTPRLDDLQNKVYAQQRYRQQQQATESKAMDEMMSKELAKVRSVDAADIANQYNQMKQTGKRLYFDPSVTGNAQKYNEFQTMHNMQYAKLMSDIRASQEQNDAAKEIAKEHFKNPYDFDPNAKEIMTLHMNTPLSELKNTKYGDLTNLWGALKKTPNFDFQKVQDAATGQPRETYSEQVPYDKEGLQSSIVKYKFGKTPAEYKASILGAIAGQQIANDKAVQLWRSIPQSEKDKVQSAFSQIPNSKWLQMGAKGPQDLEPGNPDSEAEQYASYLAKKHAIEANPEKNIDKPFTNVSAEMKAKQQDALALEKYRQSGRIDLAELKQRLKDKSADQQNSLIGQYFDVMHQEAVKRPNNIYHRELSTQSSLPLYEYGIPSDPVLNDRFKRGTGKEQIEPDTYRTDADGTYIRPVFYQRDEKTGKILYDTDGNPKEIDAISTPVPASQFKVSLGQKILSKKDEAKEISGTSSKAPKPATNYNVNGVKYTHEQLNHMGYSDEQIQQAIQLGTIKQ